MATDGRLKNMKEVNPHGLVKKITSKTGMDKKEVNPQV